MELTLTNQKEEQGDFLVKNFKVELIENMYILITVKPEKGQSKKFTFKIEKPMGDIYDELVKIIQQK